MKIRKRLIQGFIIIFVALICFPVTRLYDEKRNAEKIADKENRMINPLPVASIWQKDFYSQLEGWFQDRLNKRSEIITLWTGVNFDLGINLSKTIFLGKDERWLFSEEHFMQELLAPEKKLAKVKELQDYCLSRGVDFCFVVPFSKEVIYQDLLPQDKAAKASSVQDLEADLKAKTAMHKINYLPVSEDLMALRSETNEDIYFTDDHHWSFYGGQLAVNKILANFLGAAYKPEALDIYVDGVEKQNSYANQINTRHVYTTKAPWSSAFHKEICVQDCYTGELEEYKDFIGSDLVWKRIVKGEAVIINKKPKFNKTILILGDSYTSYQAAYFSQYLEKTVITHYKECVGEKKKVDLDYLVEKYKPDMVLLQAYGAFLYANNGYFFDAIEL